MKNNYYLSFFFIIASFLISISAFAQKGKTQEVSYSGTFKGYKGIQQPISCYCYNNGYITTKTGEQIAICFDKKFKDINIADNIEISVKGTMRTVILKETDVENPCTAGTLTVLDVTWYKCENSKDKTQNQIPISISITGTYESQKGVMDPLSCYCYNCGYLTNSKGEIIPVCLTELGNDVDINCKKVQFKGMYEMVKIESNGACPAGELKVFKVKSYKCF